MLRSQLENDRTGHMPHWRDLGDYILPRRPRFTSSDTNKGDRRNQKIIDSTASLAVRTTRSGMMSGVTSPARPWFRLGTPNPKMMEAGAVKEWLHTHSERMTSIFLKSNLYNALPIVYGDIATFGTGAMLVEEDFEDVIRCYVFPIGSYCLAQNSKLKVDLFFRTWSMTVRQIVEEFGMDGAYASEDKINWDNISEHVKQMWEDGFTENWVEVSHLIRPNPNFDPNKADSKYKRYMSCYYETGVGGTTNGPGMGYLDVSYDKYLREKGYDLFPVLAPRWEVNGQDVYATSCPGMDALGDIKQLQAAEKRIMQAIDKMVNPPMVASPELRNQKTTVLPGDITYVSMRDGRPGFAPAHEVDPKIRELEEKQAQVRERIRRAFYEDLFLMLANSDRRQITAREIDERHEEKLLALGPVLERLNQDLLDPLIDITFHFMEQQGLIDEPPQELQGMDLKVEYISIMAQAQKLVSIGGIERFNGFVGSIVAATGDPNKVKKVNFDKMIEVYGDVTSIAPGIVRSDDEMAEIDAQMQKAAQAQAMREAVPEMAGAAKTLSETDTEGDNALTRLLQQGQAGNALPMQ